MCNEICPEKAWIHQRKASEGSDRWIKIHALGSIYGIGKYRWATCGVVESGEMSARYVSVRLESVNELVTYLNTTMLTFRILMN